MGWNVLNPVGSKKGVTVDWKQRYQDVISSFDYKEVKRLTEQNKALSKKVNELSYLLSINRKNENKVSIDVVDLVVSSLYEIPVERVYGKDNAGCTRAKHILRFIGYFGYGMTCKAIGWRYGKTSHSNATRSKNRVLEMYKIGELTDAEISIIKKYTNDNIFRTNDLQNI
jgi:hypothetical protein